MKKAKFKRWVPLYLMMAPGLIYLFINNYMPMRLGFSGHFLISYPIRLGVFSYCGALLKSTVLCGFSIFQGIVLGGSKSIQVFLVLCPL